MIWKITKDDMVRKAKWFAWFPVKTDTNKWVWLKLLIKEVDNRDETYLGLLPRYTYLERQKLTREERIEWFIQRYYETGMEYELLMDSMEYRDLDNLQWYDDIIHIPQYKDEVK